MWSATPSGARVLTDFDEAGKDKAESMPLPKDRLCQLIFTAGVQRDESEEAILHKGSEPQRNAAGRQARLSPAVRMVYPKRKLPTELSRFCFPYGTRPSPQPQPPK